MKKMMKKIASRALCLMLIFNCTFSLVAFAEGSEPVVGEVSEVQVTDESTEATGTSETSEVAEATEDLEEVSSDTEKESVDEEEKVEKEESEESSSEEIVEDELIIEEEPEDEELLGAAGNKCGDNLKWDYDEATKTLTITGSGKMYDYNTSSTYSQESTAPWASYLKTLKVLNLSNDITYIGACAFPGMDYIGEIKLPNKLTGLGKYAFADTYSNQSTLVIPGSLVKVSDYAFYDCRFKKIVFSKGTKEIGSYAFWRLSADSIEWTNDIQVIGKSAFWLSWLGNFTIPAGVKTIKEGAFGHLSTTREITFEGNMPTMEEDAFLDAVVIAYYPNGNSTYSKAACDKASKYFKGVTWIAKGTAISNKAGDNITWSLDGDTLKFTGTGAMYDYSMSNLPPWFNHLRSTSTYVIDSRITSIGDYAFYHMSCSKALKLPSKLVKIGSHAFYESDIHITLPNNVTEIGDNAFAYSAIEPTSTTFPKGVKKIGDRAFYQDRFSSSIKYTISLDSIEYVGDEAFNLYYSTTNVYLNCSFPSTLRYVGSDAFDDCTSDGKELVIPANIEYIGGSAFGGIKNLVYSPTSFTVPKNVTKATNNMMYGTQITSITFNSNVKDFEEYAIAGPSTLKEVRFNCDFPENLPESFFDRWNKSSLTVYYPITSESWATGLKKVKYDSDKVVFKPVGEAATVSFIDLNGNKIDTKKLKAGEKLTQPEAPAGQNIGGWYTRKDIQTEDTKWNFDTAVNHSMTLYAGKPYTDHRVVFYIDDTNYKIFNIKDGAKVTKFADPKKDGYRFRGWYSDRFGSYGEYSFNQKITKDIVLYAHWSDPYASVIYHYNTVDHTEVHSTIYQEMLLENSTKDRVKELEDTKYYTFKGWYFDAAFQKPVPKNYTIKLMNDYEFYAKWDKKLIPVTFDYNNGTGIKKVANVEYGTYLYKQVELPTKQGYRCTGWVATKNTDDVDLVRVTGPCTVYPYWAPESWRISYYRYYGENYQNDYPFYTTWEYAGKPIPTGTEINKSIPNYTIDGYYFDQEYTKPVDSSYKIVGDTKVYVKVTPKKYTITLEPNNGQASYKVQADYDSLIKNIKAPVKKGYRFLGWATEKDATEALPSWKRVSGEATYYAVWQKFTCSVTYYAVFETNTFRTLQTIQQPAGTVFNNISKEYNANKEIDYECSETWYFDYELTEEIPSDYVLNGNLHVYAKYQGKQYTITVDPDNGKSKYTVKGRYGEEPDLEIPVKPGYEFTGWVSEDGRYTPDFKYISQDIAIKADYNRLYTQDIKITGVEDSVYQGYPITFSNIKVTDGVETLVEKKDYTVSYKNNTNVGTASVIFTFKGNYTGKKTVNFKINPANISETCESDPLVVCNAYNKKVQKTKPKIIFYAWNGKQTVKRTLTLNKDYTLSYPNDKEGAYKENGDYKILVEGKGNFTGSKIVMERISDKKLVNKLTVTGLKTSYQCTNSQIIPDFVVKDGKEIVATCKDGNFESEDIKIDYGENTKVGTKGEITILAKETSKKYFGYRIHTFNITGIALSKMVFDGFNATLPYNDGKLVEQHVKIYANAKARKDGDETQMLKKGVDYSVVYSNPYQIGTAKVTYTGLGKYTGTVVKTYKITGTSLAKAKVTGIENKTFAESYIYQKAVQVEMPDGTKLSEGKDYKIEYPNSKNYNVGTVPVRIVGINRYTGTINKSFKITPANITDESVFKVSAINPVKYTKSGAKPTIYITKFGKRSAISGTDYTVTYANNRKVGNTATATIKGKGNYTGSVTKTFSIIEATLYDSGTTVTYSVPAYKDKVGNFVLSNYLIKDKNGVKLVAGVDFDKKVVYKSNGVELNPKKDKVSKSSSVSIVLTGINNYAGSTRTISYWLSSKATSYPTPKKSIASAKFVIHDYEYTGEPICPSEAFIVGTLGGKTLELDKDYYISGYSNNVKIGTGTVKITGYGEYAGTINVKFKITPRKVKD